MKVAFAILIICISVLPALSQSDSSRFDVPKIVHVSTGSVEWEDSLSLNTDFRVLSLVSVSMFDNWNEENLKLEYKGQNVLIVVARQDTDSKTRFMTAFYQNWLSTDSKRKAYEMTIKKIGPTAEIRHLLILKE